MAATHRAQKDPQTVQVPLSNEDQKFIESLQQRPSSLCDRCSRYDVRREFEQADYKDYIDSRAISNALLAEYIDSQEKYKMYLGQLSSLHLTPSCQLCRLLYCIMPRDGLDPEDEMYKLELSPRYIQKDG